ncbi:hypothetical protein WICMUC_001801 [Wickerhamomyces mucosus]|uniref:Non-homologous end-joining factor 1 n=1 Tax=Wickerhamomyces mucosus TaxID=1378264 RepID=A0A9P8PTC3_9ASCO|nr:hypothetical protein WICMUC_001801 [Wickerhamomyces mucosus]
MNRFKSKKRSQSKKPPAIIPDQPAVSESTPTISATTTQVPKRESLSESNNKQDHTSEVENKKNMNIPRKWEILKPSNQASLPKDKKYLFGIDYSSDEYRYTIYITDLIHVWLEDVDKEKFQNKSNETELKSNSLETIFQKLIGSFDQNFQDGEIETQLILSEQKIDRGIPLELKLHLCQDYKVVKLNWKFELNRLPESSAVSILGNIILQMSTIINSLNEYSKSLVDTISKKDSTIRYFHESLKGIKNGESIIKRYGGHLEPFDQTLFNSSFKRKILEKQNGLYIWNVVEKNNKESIWNLSTPFSLIESEAWSHRSNNYQDKKNSGVNDNKRDDYNDDEDIKKRYHDNDLIPSPLKKRRFMSIENLQNEFQDLDWNKQKIPKIPEPTNFSTKDGSVQPSGSQSTSTMSSENSRSASPSRKRSGFVSRKRKIANGSTSPIKAPKKF